MTHSRNKGLSFFSFTVNFMAHCTLKNNSGAAGWLPKACGPRALPNLHGQHCLEQSKEGKNTTRSYRVKGVQGIVSCA